MLVQVKDYFKRYKILVLYLQGKFGSRFCSTSASISNFNYYKSEAELVKDHTESKEVF